MILDDESTWPHEVLRCLDKHKDIFLAYEQSFISQTPHIKISVSDYDNATKKLQAVLSKFSLRGYHCTRLTKEEIANILSEGMTLQSGRKLNQRIDALVLSGDLSKAIGRRLKNENQADDENRAEMIWFCFFPPYKAGQGGIERLFRSWGGEALYNSHENDPETGTALKRIGIPCVIEAFVPIGDNSYSYLSTKLVRIFLKNRGLSKPKCTDHEGYSTIPISPQNIHRIICFPEPDFIYLTKSNEWDIPI